MAQRIDNGVQPTAHTAVQAMIVRAQHVADRSGKAIGVHYDLANDEVSLVEISPDMTKDVTFLRIAAPKGNDAPATEDAVAGTGVDAAAGKAPTIKTASA